MSTSRTRRRTRRRSSRGFSLLEVLVVLSILAVGLLSHAASSLTTAHLMRTEARHGLALQTLRDFKARLRTELAWEGVYQMLDDRLGPAPGSPAPLTDFFPDLVVPAELGQATVLIEIPRSARADGTSGLVLREDVALPRFGLPHDLNGDGVLDDQPRNDDYHAIPVVITLEWVGRGDAPQRIQVMTWLRGERLS